MKSLKLIFSVFFAVAIVMSLLFFLSWNNYSSLVLPKIDANLDSASIDRCIFNDGYLSINGWAINKNNPQTHVRIYARKYHSNEWVNVKYSIESRPDVSNYFGVKTIYDRTGFNASIRNIKYLGGLSGEIAVIMYDEKGNTRGIKYECK